MCRVHDDADTKGLVLPRAGRGPASRIRNAARHFARFLDSPNRVILEVEPTQRIGFDGTKQTAATSAWIEAARAAEQSAARSTDRQGA